MSNESIEKAIAADDAVALVKAASTEELARLKAAEEVLSLVRERTRSTTRWPLLTSTMVGIVALLGMLVNSYQSFSSRQVQQAQIDQERWNKESRSRSPGRPPRLTSAGRRAITRSW